MMILSLFFTFIFVFVVDVDVLVEICVAAFYDDYIITFFVLVVNNSLPLSILHMFVKCLFANEQVFVTFYLPFVINVHVELVVISND